jgi:hypothetical protein
MTEYILHPGKVVKPDGETVETPEPLHWVMEHGEDGCVASLTPGKYLPWDGVKIKNQDLKPMLVRGTGGEPPIIAPKVGGTDCFGFAHPELHGNIKFEGLIFHPGYRSIGIWTMNHHLHGFPDVPYEPIAFHKCVFDGGWNHDTNEPVLPNSDKTKWALRIHRTGQLSITECTFRNIRMEHAIYASQIHGPVLIENNDIFGMGRTGVQITNRIGDNGGLPGFGEFRIRNNRFSKTGLADGGHGITVSGQTGTVYVEKNIMSDSHGQLLFWPEWEGTDYKPGTPNQHVVVVDNVISGGGTRDVVQISAVEHLYFEGNTITSDNPYRAAVTANPIGSGYNGMASQLFPLRWAHPTVWEIAKKNTFNGDVRWFGKSVNEYLEAAKALSLEEGYGAEADE